MANDTKIALASPLGGMGFAMTCWCIGFSFTGIIPDGFAMALPMALLFAGLAQFIVGFVELIRGQHALGICHGTFGVWGMGTALMFYTTSAGLVPAASPEAMAVYWGGWAIITGIIAIICWPVSKYFSLVLWVLMADFVLFLLASFVPEALQIGAWLTVFTGVFCWYVVAAFTINTSFGRPVLPVK
ncbi:Succinate-acetate/proton symporter SatP [subsurface metagenome]